MWHLRPHTDGSQSVAFVSNGICKKSFKQEKIYEIETDADIYNDTR